MSNSLLLEYRDINQVYPYTRNGRRNEETVDQVAVSIQSYGFQQPIVVDKNGVIVVGHTRYAAAKKLKLTEVPVIVFGGDDQLAKDRLADNRIQENSDWDKDVLLNELLDLKDTPLPTGFTDSELDKLLDSGTIIQYVEPTTFEIVVNVDNETDQKQLYDRLIKEDYECRLLSI